MEKTGLLPAVGTSAGSLAARQEFRATVGDAVRDRALQFSQSLEVASRAEVASSRRVEAPRDTRDRNESSPPRQARSDAPQGRAERRETGRDAPARAERAPAAERSTTRREPTSGDDGDRAVARDEAEVVGSARERSEPSAETASDPSAADGEPQGEAASPDGGLILAGASVLAEVRLDGDPNAVAQMDASEVADAVGDGAVLAAAFRPLSESVEGVVSGLSAPTAALLNPVAAAGDPALVSETVDLEALSRSALASVTSRGGEALNSSTGESLPTEMGGDAVEGLRQGLASVALQTPSADAALAEIDPSLEALSTLTPRSAPTPAMATLTALTSAGLTAVNTLPAGQGAAWAALQASVGTPEFGEELAQKLVVFSARQIQSAQLVLNPAELGPMEIKLQVHRDQAHIQVQTAVPLVRELVEGTQQRLRDLLAEQGLQLAQFDVGSRHSQQGQGEGRGGSSGEGRSSDGREEMSDGVHAQTRAVKMDRLVDYYA